MALSRSRDGMVGNRATIRTQPEELPEGGPDNTRENQENDGQQLPNGNRSAERIKSLYIRWNAAYRGLTPHGIAPRAIVPGAATAPAPTEGDYSGNPDLYQDPVEETNDPPDPFVPNLQDIVPIPVVVIDDLGKLDRRVTPYYTAFTQGVGAICERIVPRQDTRVDCRIMNLGPGTVTIAETESKGYTGFTLPASMTAPILIPTTREIWGIQQAAQVSPAQLCIILVFDKRVAD